MSVSLPSSLALSPIADGSLMIASDERNSFSAVQVGVNGLIAMFAAAETKGDLLIPSGGGTFDRLPVGTNGQVLVADSAQTLGVKWSSSLPVTYRKTTLAAVNTTVAATDLLNSEITVAAGAMGTTGALRLTAWGDWQQTSGGGAAPPRMQLIFGGTTIFDTGTGGLSATSGAARQGWQLQATILNRGAANSQSATIDYSVDCNAGFGSGAAAFTTGEGVYQALLETAGIALQARALGFNLVAVNTALAAALVLKVINGSASAAYETVLYGALIEVI